MLQRLWEIYLTLTRDTLDASDRVSFVVSTFLIHNVTFWVLNGLLFLCYHFDLFRRYRIHGAKYPDARLIADCVRRILISQFVAQWVVSTILFSVLINSGLNFGRVVPSLFTIFLQILGFMLVEDTVFYWLHRGLHHPAVYKYIHKRHHEFKATIGVASEYAHPVEGIVSNLFPFVLGPIIIGRLFGGVHLVTLWAWLFLRVCETVDAHSGFAFPFSPFNLLPFQGGAARHDFHHLFNVGSFGSFFNFWDWIMGTDIPFRQYQARKTTLRSSSSESDDSVGESSSDNSDIDEDKTKKKSE